MTGTREGSPVPATKQGVVNSIVQEVREVGFNQTQKKQKGREDDTIEKDQSAVFSVFSNGRFPAFGSHMHSNTLVQKELSPRRRKDRGEWIMDCEEPTSFSFGVISRRIQNIALRPLRLCGENGRLVTGRSLRLFGSEAQRPRLRYAPGALTRHEMKRPKHSM